MISVESSYIGMEVRYIYHSACLPREIRTGERRTGRIVQVLANEAIVDFGELGTHKLLLYNLEAAPPLPKGKLSYLTIALSDTAYKVLKSRAKKENHSPGQYLSFWLTKELTRSHHKEQR